MRMTEQERRIRIRHLKRMYRIRERKERHDKKVSGLFMKRVVFTLILAAFIFTVVMIFARVISFEAFSMMVDEALERMKKMLESNKAMQTLVSGEAGETVEKDM